MGVEKTCVRCGRVGTGRFTELFSVAGVWECAASGPCASREQDGKIKAWVAAVAARVVEGSCS